MSWDTWELPQKFSAENERSISFTFILGNMELCLHWYLPREPWENGSGCSGCFISMKIYHSSKDRKKYEPKEKNRLLLMQSISFLWYFPETFNPLILQHPLTILHIHVTGKELFFSIYQLVQSTAIYTTEASVGAIFSVGEREEKIRSDPCSLPNENSVSWGPVFPPTVHLEISHKNDAIKI